jgi:hypothetical protein
MSTAGIYNNWLSAQTQHPYEYKKSESEKTPFYFGGSQVPVNLGLEHNKPMRSAYKSVFEEINEIPMVGHGLGVGIKTTNKKNNNIRISKYMFRK